MDEFKCFYCEEPVPSDDVYVVERGPDFGNLACRSCFYDGDKIATVIYCEDGEKYRYRVYECRVESEDPGFDAAIDYMNSIGWVSTDAWRGYYAGQAPDGWQKVLDTWFGSDGHNVRGDLAEFHRLYQDEGRLPPFPMIAAFPRTSNVCTCGIEVYVPDNVDNWLDWGE